MENGKGSHTSVNMELKPVSGNQKNENLFNEVRDLITKSKSDFSSESLYQQHLHKIGTLLSENTEEIFSAEVHGKNIFHILAQNHERSSDLVKLFANYFNGNLSKSLSKEKVEHLLYSQYGAKKFTPIHMAVENGYVEFLRESLDTIPSLLGANDGEKNTPLHLTTRSSFPESLECMKTILEVIKENNLCDEILLKATNVTGQTCFHTLCSKVPLNKSSCASEKLELLLSFDCTKNILRQVDHKGKGPLHLLCSKEDQFKDPDNNKNLQQLLEKLIKSREGINFPTQDEHGQTALHLLAISECPKLLEILLDSSSEVDITWRDSHGRMAIHYAASNALRTRSKTIAKILGSYSTFSASIRTEKAEFESQDAFRNYLFWEAYEDNEGVQQTALTSACQAPSPETVEFFLRSVYEVKRDFDIWFERKDDVRETFSLKQVYLNTPAALEFLFNRSIVIDVEKSNEICVEFTTDISVLTALDRPIQEDKVFSEMEYLGYAEEWPEDIQDKLLLHPLAQCGLHAIWGKMRPYRAIWACLNIIWLISYFLLIPFNFSVEENAYPLEQIISASILGILTIFGYAYYIYQAWIMIRMKQFRKLLQIRILNWIQAILTSIVIYKVLMGKAPDSLEINCAAAGIVLSFVIFWLNFGVISLKVGIEVQYQLQTLKKILKAITCVLPIVFGFLRSFQLLLPDYFSANFAWGLSKMFVMMTGEQDFGDMYESYKKENEKSDNITDTTEPNGQPKPSHLIAFLPFLFFLFFLFLVSISFYNLVTAVAVDKIQSMRRKLEIHQIICQIRLINYVQQTIVFVVGSLSRCMDCFSFLSPSYISYKSVGQEVTLDQKLRWYIKKNIGSKAEIRKASEDAFCGDKLPKNVKKKIFEMYEKKIA